MKINKQKIFLFTYAAYICIQILSESQFATMEKHSNLLQVLRYVILLAFFGIGIYFNKKINKLVAVLLSVLIFSSIVNTLIFNGGLGVLYLIFICFASVNIDLKKLFIITIITMIGTYVFVILCSQIGILQDTVGIRHLSVVTGEFFAGDYARHSMGFIVSNQVPISFIYIYILLIILKKDKLAVWINVVFFITNFWIFYNFGSRIVFVLTLIVIIMYYFMAVKNMISIRFSLSGFNIYILIFPVALILSFLVSIMFNMHSASMSKLDLIFNHRISMAGEALRYYGLTVFGLGKDAGTYTGVYNSIIANTVDNGYVLLFIQRGIIIGIIVIFLWLMLTNIAYKKKNQYLLFVLIVLAIENMINADFISYRSIAFYCILLNQDDQMLESCYRKIIKCHKILYTSIDK